MPICPRQRALAELEPTSIDHITTDMTTHINQASAAGNHSEQVLTVLRTRLRAARTTELAQATKLTELEILDALYELERDGLVTPTVWRITDDGVNHA